MKRAVVFLVIVFQVSTSGCITQKLRDYNNELNTLHADLVRIRQTGGNTQPTEQQLAQLARESSAEAAQTSDPKTRVSLYRVAAIAAWQAGPAGMDLVFPIVDAGIAACAALPQQDNDAPRDCSMIRIAGPMAVQDRVAASLIVLQQKRTQVQQDHQRHCQELHGAEAAACRATRGKLPATDLPAVQTMFGDFETQFTKVSEARDAQSSRGVPPELVTHTDRQRLIIYCNAAATWSLSADVVDGNATFSSLTPRKAALTQRLQASGVVVDCTGVAPVQTVDRSLLQP